MQIYLDREGKLAVIDSKKKLWVETDLNQIFDPHIIQLVKSTFRELNITKIAVEDRLKDNIGEQFSTMKVALFEQKLTPVNRIAWDPNYLRLFRALIIPLIEKNYETHSRLVKNSSQIVEVINA